MFICCPSLAQFYECNAKHFDANNVCSSLLMDGVFFFFKEGTGREGKKGRRGEGEESYFVMV